MFNKAPVKLNKKTKNLIPRLRSGDIAIIMHQDIDEVAANSLVSKKVRAVINCSSCISGRYPNLGPSILVGAKIPLYEVLDIDLFEKLQDNDIVEIRLNQLIYNNQSLADLKAIDKEEVEAALKMAEDNLSIELEKFIDNTLDYAGKEKELILNSLKAPRLNTQMKGRHALVVVRGKDYKQDLQAIASYIKEVKPVLIGVDGGGDALMEIGFIPDLLIGDMDSATDKCLKRSREIIVHAYQDGKAPGLERIEALGLEASVIPAPGTSEDIAMLLAYELGAELVVAVGSHTNMVDFLEKGRKGMASTLLVRMKIGTRLMDAKGVSQLYNSRLEAKHFLWLVSAAAIPLIIIAAVSTPVQIFFKLMAMKIKLFLGR